MRADILVSGGGVVGLSFALLLDAAMTDSGRRISIAVVEPRPPAIDADPPADIDIRVSALSPASRSILEQCGTWRELPEQRIGAYSRMRVWHGAGGPDGSASLCFDAAEQGIAALGYIIENERIRESLWRAAGRRESIHLVGGATPVTLERNDDCVRLELDRGDRIEARLVVGADGAASWVRENIGIRSSSRSHDQQAIVLHVASERPHAETAWQRFLPGGPVALLPLADGRSSVVWSCPVAEAESLLDEPDAAFAEKLAAATAGVLGDLQPTTSRASFPLAMSHAHHYAGARFALIGDAAHRVHPLAGQGVNLGLLDSAALAETLAGHLGLRLADPGDAVVLRRFERWRRRDNLMAMSLIETLHRVFTHPSDAVGRAAGAGLGIVDGLPPIKRWLAGQALGRGRGVPAAAQRAGP